jgi:hypothetical protein
MLGKNANFVATLMAKVRVKVFSRPAPLGYMENTFLFPLVNNRQEAVATYCAVQKSCVTIFSFLFHRLAVGLCMGVGQGNGKAASAGKNSAAAAHFFRNFSPAAPEYEKATPKRNFAAASEK